MSHTIISKLSRPARTTNPSGSGDRGFMVDLSEMVKDKQGNKTYTNYSATLWAKQGAQDDYYTQNLVEGAIVAVSCDQLSIRPWESQGGNSGISLDMVRPRLERLFSSDQPQQQQQQQQRQQPQQAQGYQQQPQQQNYQQQPMQNQQQPNPQQQPNEFDDFDSGKPPF